MSNATMKEQLSNVEVEIASSWSKFDLYTILSEDEISALGRKAIEMKVNKANRSAFSTACDGMKLSDAGELAVYLLKKTARDYADKKRVDDAVEAFTGAVPLTLSKSAINVKLAEAAILETASTFRSKAATLEALDKWYGPASVNTSDKTHLLDCYQHTVGIIGTYFGAAGVAL